MDTMVLTMKEQQRVAVIERVFRGELTMAEAAMVLGVSERQSFRIKARIAKEGVRGVIQDRKSTRLNSRHHSISYVVFCLKKKKNPRNWRYSSASKRNAFLSMNSVLEL